MRVRGGGHVCGPIMSSNAIPIVGACQRAVAAPRFHSHFAHLCSSPPGCSSRGQLSRPQLSLAYSAPTQGILLIAYSRNQGTALQMGWAARSDGQPAKRRAKSQALPCSAKPCCPLPSLQSHASLIRQGKDHAFDLFWPSAWSSNAWGSLIPLPLWLEPSWAYDNRPPCVGQILQNW